MDYSVYLNMELTFLPSLNLTGPSMIGYRSPIMISTKLVNSCLRLNYHNETENNWQILHSSKFDLFIHSIYWTILFILHFGFNLLVFLIHKIIFISPKSIFILMNYSASAYAILTTLSLYEKGGFFFFIGKKYASFISCRCCLLTTYLRIIRKNFLSMLYDNTGLSTTIKSVSTISYENNLLIL